MLTEQTNPNSTEIDRLPTLEVVRLINAEDRSVAFAVEQVLPQIAEAVDAIADAFQQGGRLIYAGAGTSGRLGVLDAVECVPTFGTPPEMVQGLIAGGDAAFVKAVEGAEDDRSAGVNDLKNIDFSGDDILIGIAASGHTPYVLGALEYARSLGAKTVGVACNAPSPVLESADIAIGVVVGPEVIAGSTRLKAGTAQKMVLNMLSTAAMVKMGKVYSNLMVDVQITNAKLAQRAARIVARVAQVDEDRARELLKASNNEVKTAIVMQKRDVSYDEAKALLDAAKGHLREVIGDPQTSTGF